MTKREVLVRAAMAGLLGAAVLAAPGSAKDKGKKGGLEKCYGINKCSGHGACGGKGHACAGKNNCKGQGWVEVKKGACNDIENGSLTAPEEKPVDKPADQPAGK